MQQLGNLQRCLEKQTPLARGKPLIASAAIASPGPRMNGSPRLVTLVGCLLVVVVVLVVVPFPSLRCDWLADHELWSRAYELHITVLPLAFLGEF